MAEAAILVGAVWHDGGFFSIALMADEAILRGFGGFVVFALAEVGRGPEESIADSANHQYPDGGHGA